MSELFITGIIIGVVIALIFRPSPRIDLPAADLQAAKTAVDTLKELEAQAKLERDYKFVVPEHAYYYGKKIAIKDVTSEMLKDSSYLSPLDMGRWVKR